MFTKLATLIVFALALAMETPARTPPQEAGLAQQAPAARLSLCLGPVVLGFATPGGAPFTLKFNTAHACTGFAGLVQAGAAKRPQDLKNYPSAGGFSQKLPSLLPPRH